MKAGIFDPYLDTIGGGERYAMTIAEALLEIGWHVDVFWNDEKIKQKLIEKFSLEVERINFVPYSSRTSNLLKRKKIESNYDLLFYFSDGSIPFMFGKKNILHFQVPFKNVLKKSLKNTLKLKRIFTVVCNSYFTKKFVDKGLGIASKVIFPPVDVELLEPMIKKNVILSVGRFSQLLQGKRQDVLVDVFKKMVKEKKIQDWKLILAGGSEIGSTDYLRELRQSSGGFPIEIVENPSFEELKKLYGEAKIFWTASGYGMDEEREPERVEHFGMSTVEAMAAGCVPIVMKKGGQKEIIENGKNGFLWQEKEELKNLTMETINNPQKAQTISKNAILRSKDYSKEVFYSRFYSLVDNESS